MSQLDRHLTTEQLSALLDNQVSEGEQEEGAYRAHLQTCEQCQLEFAELRQTVRLLRALPTPPLPRSFTLPADISWEPIEIDEESASQAPEAPPPISLPQRRLQRSRQTTANQSRRSALRLISGLVAVIGICFMLSTLQLPHGGGTGGTATSASSSYNSGPNSANNPSTPHAATTTGNGGKGSNSATPGPTTHKPTIVQQATPQSTPVDTQPVPLQILDFFGIGSSVGRLRLGLLLFIIGALGFYIFKQKYRHRWR